LYGEAASIFKEFLRISSDLNIYDTKQLSCFKCGKNIGEVTYDAEIIFPKCGQCAEPLPENDDKVLYSRRILERSQLLTV